MTPAVCDTSQRPDWLALLEQAAAIVHSYDTPVTFAAALLPARSSLLLAVQMAAVHNAAAYFLQRATIQGQTSDCADANVFRATRLMRLFNEQLEAMAKLKGTSGQQKVTVEHVHVHGGGQAIVGAVTTRRTEGGAGGG